MKSGSVAIFLSILVTLVSYAVLSMLFAVPIAAVFSFILGFVFGSIAYIGGPTDVH